MARKSVDQYPLFLCNPHFAESHKHTRRDDIYKSFFYRKRNPTNKKVFHIIMSINYLTKRSEKGA